MTDIQMILKVDPEVIEEYMKIHYKWGGGILLLPEAKKAFQDFLDDRVVLSFNQENQLIRVYLQE